MKSYILCETCGERISTSFSYCPKCGGNLSQDNKTIEQVAEKKDIESIAETQTSTSPSLSSIEKEKGILTELDKLKDSLLTGRIVHLLHNLEQLPNLSPESNIRLEFFASHSNEDVQATAKKILRNKFGENFKTDPAVAKAIEERMSFQDNLNIYKVFGPKINKWASNLEMIVIILFLGVFALLIIISFISYPGIYNPNLPIILIGIPFFAIFISIMYIYVKRKVKEAKKQNLQE